MADWNDLGIELARALADTEQSAGDQLSPPQRQCLREAELNIREIVNEEQTAAGVYPQNAAQLDRLWQELKAAAGLPDTERFGPLMDLTANFLSTGPHGKGKPPRR